MNKNNRNINNFPINRRGFLSSALSLPLIAGLGLPALAAQSDKLRVALASFGGEQMDPAIEARASVFEIWLMVYENLIEIGQDNGLEPGLAESWSVDDSGKIWTFKLREGVQFHDGWGEMTAEDAIFSLNRWMDKRVTAPSRSLLVAAVDKIVELDRYRFAIHTKKVVASLPYLLSPHEAVTGIVFSKKYLLEQGGVDFPQQTDALNRQPIGTGPYRLASRARGESLLFEANTAYWKAQPTMQQIEILLIPDPSTQVAMLQSGDVDMVNVDFDRAQAMQSDDRIKIFDFANSVDFGFLFYATYADPAKGTPMADVRVRHALSKAIDRQTLIDALLYGNARLPSVPWPMSAHAQGIEVEDYTDWAKDLATYDPDGAKVLLAEAGYPDGFSGGRLYLTHFPGTLANAQQVVLAIAQMWEKIGVKINIETMDFPNLRPRLVGDPESPEISPSIVPFSAPPRFTTENLLTIWYQYQDRKAAKSQLTKIDAVDEAIVQLDAALSPETRRQVSRDILTRLNDEWVAVPILTSSVLVAVNADRVGNMVAREGWPAWGRVYDTVTSA